MRIGRDIPRYTAALAGILGLVFAVGPPVSYFALSWQSTRVSLEKEAEANSYRVSRFVAANPLLWQFDEVRLMGILEGDNGRILSRCRIVHDLHGIVAKSCAGDLPWPVISRSHTVWDAGTEVGRVEIQMSLRPLVRTTAAMGAASALLSSIGLALFFLYPVSALRKALGELWETKERAQVTLHAIADGVIATDTGGRILLMNHVAETITGSPSAEALGKPLDDVIRFERPGEDAAPPVDPHSPSTRILVSGGGEKRLVETSYTEIIDREGNRAGSVLILRDVTDKVRMEEELLRGRKLESLGILAGGIAHDFNNLLTGILGNISLAKEMVDPGKRAYRRLEEAEKSSLKAKDLATRLLVFSKGGKPIRRKISVAEVLKDAVDLALRGTGVRCEYRIPEGIRDAYADAGQIGQVFHNLATNAAEAMPGGGTLRVTAENIRLLDGEVPHIAAGNYVKIGMADEGTGIASDILPRIFDPYFSTKDAGNGLGLTTCYSILKNHGGNIFATSPAGAGATFHIYLPAAGDAEREIAPPEAETAMPGSATVLLMDDEEVVLDVVGEMLKHLGYKPEFARNGSEAISKFEEAAQGQGVFDLVIVDLTIPGGMGGKEAASRILAKHPGARIIVSSGYSNDPVMSRYREHGFAGVIAKPYKLGELSHVLRQAMGKMDAAAPGPPDPSRDEPASTVA